jgi:branched-subunit amino acid ABC-type transport system permease component
MTLLISYRLEVSRIGRAWMAIREDEIAAKAMGLNTRNLKLLAFGMGATFGGVSGAMFAGFQGFISPESFSLMESVMIIAMVVLGGIARGAALCGRPAARDDGRSFGCVHHASVVGGFGHDRDHVVASPRAVAFS